MTREAMYAGRQPPDKPRCKSHGLTKCIADPKHLFRIVCTECDFFRDYSQNGSGAAKYLYHRRRTRAAQGLLSVGAPLDAASAAFLCQTSAECGIVANTGQPHVSFVEGLIPEIDHTTAVGQLNEALFHNRSLEIARVHRVPRRDNVTDLILADVVLSFGADYAARQLADGWRCNLPQFPFHVALGACPRAGSGSKLAAARAEARMRGVTLAVDPARVRVLPPPDGVKKKVGSRSYIRHRPPHPGAHFQGRYADVQASPPEWSVPRNAFGGYSEPETDETDAASLSSASLAPEDNKADFPGLAVDLTFLD